jgi:hypothetical protein
VEEERRPTPPFQKSIDRQQLAGVRANYAQVSHSLLHTEHPCEPAADLERPIVMLIKVGSDCPAIRARGQRLVGQVNRGCTLAWAVSEVASATDWCSSTNPILGTAAVRAELMHGRCAVSNVAALSRGELTGAWRHRRVRDEATE